ncbi:MAG: YicC/YloC family endoribonuclease [Eubacteriales bacterium]|nr:YicC/YloC family endoribonuclease [Eubacteriales bacterium]
MIKSMTGYGRGESSQGQRKVTVEMKSVNNRYLDVNIRMPKKLNFFEAAIRAELKKFIQRGKIDLFLTYDDLTENNLCVKYNKELAAEYYHHLQQMAEDLSLTNDVRLSQIAQLPDVFTMEEQTVDEEELWNLIRAAIGEAAAGFVESRVREGEFLRNDLSGKLDELLDHVAFITERSPAIIDAYRENLRAKVQELLQDTSVDEGRLLQEVTIYADKVCVDEELVRLRSHIEATKQALSGDEGVGRKLDFLAQEMNREANTILSKSGDLEVSARAIELKTGIEKIREQIQNIE